MQKTTIYRKLMEENLFEEEFTIETLSQMGNLFEELASLVDFETFRPTFEDVLVKKEMNSIICEKGHRNNPLTEEQKKSNRIKSKDRCRIEHIFGFIEGR